MNKQRLSNENKFFTLFKKGKVAWNEQIKGLIEDPTRDKKVIDFSDITFEASDHETIDFEGFIFPDDVDVIFTNAQFLNNVTFVHAKFGGVTSFKNTRFQGDVNFTRATFYGVLKFNNAVFQDESSELKTHQTNQVYFKEAQFNQRCDFEEVAFFCDDIDFSSIKSTYSLNFQGAKFNFNSLSFYKASLGVEADSNTSKENNLNFKGVIFKGDRIKFNDLKLGKSFKDVNFSECDFVYKNFEFNNVKVEGSIKLIFDNSTFEGSRMFFSGSEISGEGFFEFGRCSVNTNMRIENKFFKNWASINFNGTFFDKTCVFDNPSFCCIPNFILSKSTSQIVITPSDFDNVNKIIKIEKNETKSKTGENSRLKAAKLKEFAMGVGNHQALLFFNEMEIKLSTKLLPDINKDNAHTTEVLIKGLKHLLSLPLGFLNILYISISGCGTKIVLPILLWLLQLLFFSFIYTDILKIEKFTDILKVEKFTDILKVEKFIDAASFSFHNSIPGLSTSRLVKSDFIEKYYSTPNVKETSDAVKSFNFKDNTKKLNNQQPQTPPYNTMSMQYLISSILLFLVGLGLRNRYKL